MLKQFRYENELSAIRNTKSANLGDFSDTRFSGIDDIGKLVVTVKGGNINSTGQGTWMHEDVALEFARWLSPKFAIWCNDRIKELMKYGFTATDKMLEEIIADPLKVLEGFAKLSKQILLEREQKAAAEDKVKELTPKAEFYDRVKDSESTLDMATTAKVLKLPYGRNIMMSKLRIAGVLMKNNAPYQKYIDSKHFKVCEAEVYCGEGRIKIVSQTFVYQKGLMLIQTLLCNQEVVA